jgi:hypothetical protein
MQYLEKMINAPEKGMNVPYWSGSARFPRELATEIGQMFMVGDAV